jgi:hypothetical protein
MISFDIGQRLSQRYNHSDHIKVTLLIGFKEVRVTPSEAGVRRTHGLYPSLARFAASQRCLVAPLLGMTFDLLDFNNERKLRVMGGAVSTPMTIP